MNIYFLLFIYTILTSLNTMIKIYEQYALKYNYYSTVILKKIDLIRGNFLIVEVLVSFENNS